MKKYILKIVACTFIFINLYTVIPSFGQCVFAEEITTISTNDEVESKLNGLYDYMNTMKSDVELMNELDPVSYIQSYIENGEGNISIGKIVNAVISLFFREIKSVLALSFSIIVIGIICSLFKNIQAAFSSEGISQIAFYACYALLIIILSKTFMISLDLAKDVIVEITNFMSKLLPVLVVMLAAAGGLTQAATIDPIVLGATIIVPKIYTDVIIPLILMTFVVKFTNNISSEAKLSNLSSMMEKAVTWIQGLVLTVFIGLLTIRGITSSTIDAVTLKTSKLAIESFIPIVGKSLSDSISSVAGYSLIIKNAIGSIGLIAVILIIIYPIIKIVLSSIIFKLSASLLEPITDKRITNSIAAAGKSLVLIMSCVISVSLMFFILIAMMISAGKFVIGG